jgi:hypothetical protein
VSTNEIFAHAVIVPVCKQGDKTDCSNCVGISLLSTSYITFYQLFSVCELCT